MRETHKWIIEKSVDCTKEGLNSLKEVEESKTADPEVLAQAMDKFKEVLDGLQAILIDDIDAD